MLATLALAFAPVAGFSSVLYYDSFAGYNPAVDPLPTGWVNNSSAANSFLLAGPTGESYLRSPAGVTSSNAFYGGAGSANWSNYEASVIVIGFLGGTATANAGISLSFYVQETASQNYQAYWRSDGTFSIGKNGAGFSSPTTILATAEQSAPWNAANANAAPHLIRASIDSTGLITASLYSSSTYTNITSWSSIVVDEDPYSKFTTLVASVSFRDEDNPYTSGTVGLNWRQPGGSRDMRASHFSVIPEPSFYASLAGILALVMTVGIRRWRKA